MARSIEFPPSFVEARWDGGWAALSPSGRR